jgi:ATP-dependent DNA ligase
MVKRAATTLDLPAGLEPMEAESADALPSGEGWQFEPKWDGFRCIARREADKVTLTAKSGKPLGRYFPDVVAALEAIDIARFAVDGELVIPVGSRLSFDALQLRLHPAASRVQKLAAEHPARLVLFDMLAGPDGASLLEAPLSERRAVLEKFVAAAHCPVLRLSPFTLRQSEAKAWLAKVGDAIDGVVAKRVDGPSETGVRAMVKVKNLRTADCVVGGYRVASKGGLVGSLLLGLFDDDGLLNHVGFTSGFSGMDKKDLTAKLDALRGGPGFTGRAPGGPSRWSTERSTDYVKLRHDLVVEVRYDHVTGDRFRHGTGFLRWRPDKAPRQCTFEQLGREARPSRLISALMEA